MKAQKKLPVLDTLLQRLGGPSVLCEAQLGHAVGIRKKDLHDPCRQHGFRFLRFDDSMRCDVAVTALGFSGTCGASGTRGSSRYDRAWLWHAHGRYHGSRLEHFNPVLANAETDPRASVQSGVGWPVISTVLKMLYL